MWLDRTLIQGPKLKLCLSQGEFTTTLNALQVFEHPPMLDGSYAVTHRIWAPEGPVYLVALDLGKMATKTIAEVHGLLVHEAVHVFQYFCTQVGETQPSIEFEAYSIQHLAVQLMEDYAQRTL